jgi:hypothetical protein
VNNVDGACACCDRSTPYTGRLPIICPTCADARKRIFEGTMASLIGTSEVNSRLFLPDSELMPRPTTEADL